VYNKILVHYGNQTSKLGVVRLARFPLFKSYDGEDIYLGQPYYAVTKDFRLAYCSFYSEQDLDMKLFAKKENAETYIKTYKNYKTADGEPIVEGQRFYIYDDKFFKCVGTSFGTFTSEKWAGKRFKTEDEVKELIKLNKPQYSLYNIEKALKNNLPQNSFFEKSIMITLLKDLENYGV
jgi:hypothetical protein